jgi:hypothetical protein
VVLTEDDDVLTEFPPDGTAETLGNAVLRRAPVAAPDGLDVHRPERRDDVETEGSVAVKDQVLWCRLEGEGLASCRATQAAVGLSVTAYQATSRRTCRMKKRT